MKQRSILALPVTLLALAAIAAPVWASDDDDDEGGGEAIPTTPFVQSPAPAPIAAPPTAAPVVTPAPVSAPPATVVPARENRNRTTRRARRHTPTTKVVNRKPVARAAAARQTTVPRGGVQAGAGGMAPGA